MNKSTIYFIINPISGGHNCKDTIVSCIQSEFGSNERYTYTIKETAYKGHAKEIAQEAVNSEIDIVVAIGGDGTINEVATELIHSNVSLGIVPRGSGNGIARNLGIPLEIENALSVIGKFHKRRIDTGVLNTHNFVGLCGIGFDAHISREFSTSTKRGFISYIKITLKELFSYQSKAYTIELEGHSFTESAFLLACSNSKQYGNNAYITPLAEIDNGVLDMCLIKKTSAIASIVMTARIFMGTIHKSKHVLYKHSKKIKVNSTDNMAAHIDGEYIDIGNKAEIEIKPESLYVITQ